MVEVLTGPHERDSGIAIEVQRLVGTVKFVVHHSSRQIEVPLTSVKFTPDPHALRFTADRGYDVRKGDHVVVVRGDFRGRSGMVYKVDLDQKTLDVGSYCTPPVCVMQAP